MITWKNSDRHSSGKRWNEKHNFWAQNLTHRGGGRGGGEGNERERFSSYGGVKTFRRSSMSETDLSLVLEEIEEKFAG